MKHVREKKSFRRFIFGFLFCLMLSGCGRRANRPDEMEADRLAGQEQAEEEIGGAEEEQIHNASKLSAEQTDVYEQMALYIQEGFRTYGIEESYQAYFGPIEELDGTFFCDILLEGTDVFWSEYIAYTVEEDSGWYTFEGQYEPVFSGVYFWELDEDSEYVINLQKNYEYKVQIAQKEDLSGAVHYYGEGGPVERDDWKFVPFADTETDYDYYVQPYLYTYQDERMDIDIVIEYPQIWLSDEAVEKRINEVLKKAFFYGYYTDGEETLLPAQKEYTSIGRTYLITREDERYLSMRIYEYNDTRGVNHPNQWETGITIDLQTGKALRLEDVIGRDNSVKSLLESGSFESLTAWEGESAQDWIDRLDLDEEEPLSTFDSYFYLTEDGIGLITFSSRYYNCLEAPFDALGLDGI